MQVFRKYGFDGSSIPMLTEAMGISAQSLYAAFCSKDALYREAVDLYLRTNGAYFANALQEEPDTVEAVRRMLRDAVATLTEFTSSGCMITNAPGGSGEHALAQYGRQLRADGLEAIQAHMERSVAEGRLKPDTDVLVWARYVAASIYGLSVQARDGVPPDVLLQVADVAARHLEQLRP
jgi:AcrR family transcriptional regulator